MWNSKGRSGYGDQAIIGSYEDWEGLSMNGRQVKNELTKETRNLSGADYWHTRKAIKPTEVTPDVWVNGRANVNGFKDDVPKVTSKAKQKHIRDRICPQNVTLNNLDLQEKLLDEAYLSEEVYDNEYLELSRALEAKRQRAHKSLMRALGLPSDYYALQPSFSGEEGEAIGQPTPAGQRPLYACFSLLKGAFVRSIEAVRSGDYRKVLESIKKIAKNPTIIFLTRCIGLAIILLTVSKL
jgi:hypothetical protein